MHWVSVSANIFSRFLSCFNFRFCERELWFRNCNGKYMINGEACGWKAAFIHKVCMKCKKSSTCICCCGKQPLKSMFLIPIQCSKCKQFFNYVKIVTLALGEASIVQYCNFLKLLIFGNLYYLQHIILHLIKTFFTLVIKN